jgi:hypothetical protein
MSTAHNHQFTHNQSVLTLITNSPHPNLQFQFTIKPQINPSPFPNSQIFKNPYTSLQPVTPRREPNCRRVASITIATVLSLHGLKPAK